MTTTRHRVVVNVVLRRLSRNDHFLRVANILGVDTPAALADTFRTRILPLLQECFYDDWAKIRAVLNDTGSSGSRLRRRSWSERIWWMPAGPCTTAARPMTARWTTATADQAIYEPKVSTEDGNVAQAPDHANPARADGSGARAADWIA